MCCTAMDLAYGKPFRAYAAFRFSNNAIKNLDFPFPAFYTMCIISASTVNAVKGELCLR